ncbi:MAG: ribbon-helix-helix domain-containing protein [Pirellulales bacterium]
MAKKKQHGGKREGAGRRPSNPEGRTIAIAATIPETLVARLDELAKNEGWSRSEAITAAIRKLLGRKRSNSP